MSDQTEAPKMLIVDFLIFR